jgi:hypothetical protein
LLRHLARRPVTAAAMTPGFWRLSVALDFSQGINPHVLNRIARRWRFFRCGFIRCRGAW